jgi:hypothetical protein
MSSALTALTFTFTVTSWALGAAALIVAAVSLRRNMISNRLVEAIFAHSLQDLGWYTDCFK